MLDIGTFPARSCDGLTRRAFVRAAVSLPAALGLSPAAPGGPGGSPRPRSVLLVWLWGGPSHIDTFDPKPRAPDRVRGPFAPIATRNTGVHFTEIFPRLAARSDRFSVIRSHVFSANHSTQILTGSSGDAPAAPNFGSIVARKRDAASLPSFLCIAPPAEPQVRYNFALDGSPGGGKLGTIYNPTVVTCSPTGQTGLPSIKLLDGLIPQRLNDRRTLRASLDQAVRSFDGAPQQQWNAHMDKAFTLLTAPETTQAFDLSREDEQTRAAYGFTSFGQSLLLGCRLIAAGVPYVQVNWSRGVDGFEEGAAMGWDHHRNAFEQLASWHGPVFDRAFAALLDDLEQRGLLERTLVLALGEMGRKPFINDGDGTGGRDHWATAFSLWAGGGVQGGRVVGETDAMGGQPVTEPITPLMVGTTIAEVAGIDAEARAKLSVLPGGRVIHELF